jgi:trimeric autotransporter adhesin
MSGTLKATNIQDGASSTVNLALDSSGNVTVGNNLTVSGTGNQVFGGNVGIGITPNSSVKLQVKTATNQDLAVVSSSFVSGGVGLSAVNDAYNAYTALDLQGTSIQFGTGGTERMRIDSSGNVGIGTTSPGSKLDVNGQITARSTLAIYSSGASNLLVRYANSINRIDSYNDPITATTPLQFDASQYTFLIADAEKMRLDTSGNLLVGTTTANAQFYVLSAANVVSGRFQNAQTSGTSVDILQSLANQSAGTGFYLARFYSAGTPQFAVRGDGVVYAQNTTIQSISDQRLKENIVDATDGLNIIQALKPRRFDWKENFGNNKKHQLGFIAQEMETVFPEAVDVWHMDQENTEEYKSVGAGALIPVLVKALQETVAKIDALETRIAKLESK